MSKRTPTTDVFVMVAEHNDDEADQAAQPTPEPDTAESRSDLDSVDPDGESAIDIIDETSPVGQSGDTSARRARRRIATALSGIVIVAALGSSTFLGWRLMQLDSRAAAGQAALTAARDYAVTLTTLDANDIDKNYERALDGATGQFKDDFSQASAQLRQVLIDNKAAGKGVVVDAAIKSASRNKVEMLLFVDQSITNALNPSPRIDRNRVQMTMELIDRRWLASKVEIV
ncbi:Mce protein [Mycobacterium sp. pUA109]|uniref:Mce protein n=1 Tax=Mycobacterium sp. pUA109 TaxID=3238982 RepID=UPI00351B7883